MARLSEEQKAAVREQILDTSSKMFLVDGYDKTSTAKIAKAVGIAEGTIFNYFHNKAALFVEVLAHSTQILAGEGFETSVGSEEANVIILDFVYQTLKNVLWLPKPLVKEVMGVMVTVARKQMNLLMKLIEMDFRFLEEMGVLTDKLIREGKLVPCDGKILSETLYSTLMFEIVLYIYKDDSRPDALMKQIEKKINFVLEPYLIRQG